MKTLKETAQEYEAPSTMNIADLQLVPVDCAIEERKFKEGTDEEFTIKVALVNGESYRVPNSVLDTLRTLLKEMPSIKYVKVIKEGTGMNTRYKVVPKESSSSPSEVSSQQM